MKTIEVVAAIIINDKKVLCMQRGPHKFPYLSNKYEFPGGKVENGESRPDALKREIEEEMGITLDVQEGDFYMTVDHTYPDFGIHLHGYTCRVEEQSFSRREHKQHQWLPISELKSLDWAAADFPIVEKLMEKGFDG